MWFMWLMILGGLVGGALLLAGLYAIKSGVVFGKGGAYNRKDHPVTYCFYIFFYIFIGLFQVVTAVLFGMAAFPQ